MNIKDRLNNLTSILDKYSIKSNWIEDNCLLVEGNSLGFDVKFEFTEYDMFMWFDDLNINVHPKEFDNIISYIEATFTGRIKIRKTFKNDKIIKLELLRKEDDNWITEISVNNKDRRFWVKESVIEYANEYKINIENLKNI